MKNRNSFRCFRVGMMTAFPFLNGCTQQSTNGSPASVINSGEAITTIAPAPPDHPTFVSATVPPETVAAASQTPAIAAEPLILTNTPTAPVMPKNLRVSKALGEVIQLAQSSVDEA